MAGTSPIAVVGIGGVFPQALDVEAFWRNLEACVDTSREVPPGRWVLPAEAAHRDGAPDRVASRRGCFIDVEVREPGLEGLDPLYSLSVRAARMAFDDARMAEVDCAQVGVVLASIALPTDGSSALTAEMLGEALLPSSTEVSVDPRNSRVVGLPAALVAQTLGLGGGTLTLDAACASSLYAIKLACDALHAGRADAMLAGGVNRTDSLYTQMGFTALQALSPSGRCAPFDVRGDGLVVGEGAGFVVLKRLDDARRDGDHVYGIIRGIGLSNDIGGSLLAPDVDGQLRAMRDAYAAAGWTPNQVDLIECHGTGTPTGDRIELQSLQALWGPSGWTPAQCAIGSVKSGIGHLLTGAGIAAFIKVLLAMREGVLPPSINFEQAHAETGLGASPFRVQTKPEHWLRRNPRTPRRAAVSGFGFGGVNAHLLVEEDADPSLQIDETPSACPVAEDDAPEPIAIVGMAVQAGGIDDLRAFQHLGLGGGTALGALPTDGRWPALPGFPAVPGAYIAPLSVPIGRFKISPKDIPGVLPQQLLMLEVAARAVEDAGMAAGGRHERAAAVIGISLDLNTTNFHLRWMLPERLRAVGLDPNEPEVAAWLAEARDAACPALDANRVMGALGSIAASRVARELGLGGPSFAISCEEASGLRALEVAVDALRAGELSWALAAAVDLNGDPRAVKATGRLRPWSRSGTARALDAAADGPLPGEGAVALVLKRLSDAEAAGDRVYAVIRGMGTASGAAGGRCTTEAYLRALDRAYRDAGVPPASVSCVEANGSGDPREDAVEADALRRFFGDGQIPCAVSALPPVTGALGAAAGLASVARAALALYHEVLPPLQGLEQGRDEWGATRLHLPPRPLYWARDRVEGPRRAGVSVMTLDGNAMHVVLEGVEPAADARGDHRHPGGALPASLFIVSGDVPASLSASLDGLRALVEEFRGGLLEDAARAWLGAGHDGRAGALAVALTARDWDELGRALEAASQGVRERPDEALDGRYGAWYSPRPLGGEVAFIFPGSGSHYVGMGRALGAAFPRVVRQIDEETRRWCSQWKPAQFAPYRAAWRAGWEREALAAVESDIYGLMFGQVTHGIVASAVARAVGITPHAVIGYSLGESSGLFGLRAWMARDEMHERLMASPLFIDQLAGRCLAARAAFGVADGEPFSWTVAVVNRPADEVMAALRRFERAALLIVNTDRECVIGGDGEHVCAVVAQLGCESFFLEGVPTVHCRALVPVAEAYRDLHRLPVSAVPQRFYSGAWARAYPLDSEQAALSILENALHGLSYPATIRQAYDDGVRIFLEMGPQASCTRMIRQILEGRPHMARSISMPGEDETVSLVKAMAALAAERVDIDAAALLTPSRPLVSPSTAGTVTVPVAIPIRPEAVPMRPRPNVLSPVSGVAPSASPSFGDAASAPLSGPPPASGAPPLLATPSSALVAVGGESPLAELDRLALSLAESGVASARAHESFLALTQTHTRAVEHALRLQMALLDGLAGDATALASLATPPLEVASAVAPAPPPLHPDELPGGPRDPKRNWARDAAARWGRQMCLEFARGSVAAVLGPEFAPVDGHPTRVRLPDEPLMLCDRIMEVEGEPRSLSSGRLVTEHDVLEGAWYLDGNRAPVFVSVEAGQADLFLSSYLGIDFTHGGTRMYRLLDATVTFHRGLPQPGEMIRYDIRIDRFVRQGEVTLFFFTFDGTIDGQPFLTMRKGCAGFFTYEEIANSGGIVLTEAENAARMGVRPTDWRPLVPFEESEAYDENQVRALRRGDLAACFGPAFAGLALREPTRLPEGRLALFDRVLSVEPRGGRFGLGRVRAEADIHPDDWFLTCHFVDDMVMPGTLMYECCAHTLRVLLMRMGWVGEHASVAWEPVTGNGAALRCRGPVTASTKKVTYEIEIKEMGYRPEPYVIADAMMYADGRAIVRFVDMSMQATGLTRQSVEALWSATVTPPASSAAAALGTAQPVKPALYTHAHILEFAIGRPSLAFGAPYLPYDDERRCARLPGPPYMFLDRITELGSEPFVCKAGGWFEAEYDIPVDAWYFRANRQPCMPFAVLLETALQPCGWLAAYLGSALASPVDLKFRNLGGTATWHEEVFPTHGTLATRVRMTRVSQAGGMIIEDFDMEMTCDGRPVYSGVTTFGFFSASALTNQIGIRDARERLYVPSDAELARARSWRYAREAPRTPDDATQAPCRPASLPGQAFLFNDEVEAFVADGGPNGLGYIRGGKTVDADEWFFKAHFYQDPVVPGSIGLEAFIQLLETVALERWPHLAETHRFVPTLLGEPHTWVYRGQVTPANKRVTVEAWITAVREDPHPTLVGSGFLHVDGLTIYEMRDFGIRMVPVG